MHLKPFFLECTYFRRVSGWAQSYVTPGFAVPFPPGKRYLYLYTFLVEHGKQRIAFPEMIA